VPAHAFYPARINDLAGQIRDSKGGAFRLAQARSQPVAPCLNELWARRVSGYPSRMIAESSHWKEPLGRDADIIERWALKPDNERRYAILERKIMLSAFAIRRLV